MITMEHGFDRDNASPKVSERVFGLVVGTLLTLLSTVPILFGKPLKPRLLGFALVLATLGLVCPLLLKWPMRIWLFLTHKVSLVVNFVLLGVIFYGVVTPVAIWFRILGRDPLRRRLDLKAPSYWVDRTKEVSGSMQNQF